MSGQIIVAFIFGVAFVVGLVVLAIAFPRPTPFQYNVFRVVLALAAAGIAAMIPGFVNLEVSATTGLLLRAGGALAVFGVVFFFNPAQLALQNESQDGTKPSGEAVRHGSPRAAVPQSAPSASTPPIDAAPSAAPPKTYRRLIGRQADVDKVMTSLRDPQKRIVLVTGLGGIGKTALAREAVEQCVSERLFDYVVWSSARTEQFAGETAQALMPEGFTFATLVDEIARQIGQEDIIRMRLQDRQAAVKSLLMSTRALIVADNLDTVQNGEDFVGDLFSILGKSKAICTSRHGLKDERLYHIALKGLTVEAGKDFLRDEANARNVSAVATASDVALSRIHRATGGAPLAMKLVVGQMSRQALKDVLEALERASSAEQDYEFYRYVYQRSWTMLDDDAQKAFVSMAIFPPVTGGSVDDVRRIVGLDSPVFWPAMERLILLSLVDKVGPAGRERLALHPLTQYFVLSDIVKKWSDA